jgi:hypothetical protein
MMPWVSDHPEALTIMAADRGSPSAGAGADGPAPATATPTIMTIATNHPRR